MDLYDEMNVMTTHTSLIWQNFKWVNASIPDQHTDQYNDQHVSTFDQYKDQYSITIYQHIRYRQVNFVI